MNACLYRKDVLGRVDTPMLTFVYYTKLKENYWTLHEKINIK
jgi:hypothetical protein